MPETVLPLAGKNGWMNPVQTVRLGNCAGHGSEDGDHNDDKYGNGKIQQSCALAGAFRRSSYPCRTRVVTKVNDELG